MKEAADAAKEGVEQGLEADEWLLDVNSSSCNAPALFKERDVAPGPPLVDVEPSAPKATSSSSSSSSCSETDGAKGEKAGEGDGEGEDMAKNTGDEEEKQTQEQNKKGKEESATTTSSSSSSGVISGAHTIAEGGVPQRLCRWPSTSHACFTRICPYEKGTAQPANFVLKRKCCGAMLVDVRTPSANMTYVAVASP